MNSKKKASLKLATILIVIVGCVVLIRETGLMGKISLTEIRSLVDSLGVWGSVGFVIVYAVTTSFGLPGTIITVAGGLIFGRWLGTVLNIIGATLGASGAFWIARLVARDTLSEKFQGQKWFEKFNAGMEKDGFNYLLFVRLVPVFPYNGINFGAGLTKISFKDYITATAIGIIPGSFVFTNAAAEIGESASGGGIFSPGVMLAFVLLGLFALIPVLHRKFKAKKTDEEKNG